MILGGNNYKIPADFEAPCAEFLDTPIDVRFDRIAERHAGDTAIEESRHRWTYAELKRHVDRIAALLSETGAANQHKPVVLWLPTAAPVCAAMLATLKAGGFYVVVEPGHPIERNAAIVDDCLAEWIVSDTKHRDIVATRFPDKRVLMWDAAAGASSKLRAVADPSALRAAIVYTSGSTGSPKGVVYSHAFILNWTRLYVSDLHLAPSDRIGSLYSASVAGAARDIYGALLTGATLVPVAVREYSFDDLARSLDNCRISVYHSIPGLFHELITAQSSVAQFTHVRALIFGGERFRSRDLSPIRERFAPDTTVCTTIGCTEAGTFARLFLRSDSDPASTAVPLGLAPAECRVMLLDDNDIPVAAGEIGEIIVESRYLADGYWRRTEESALKFERALDGSGWRRYRTGDLGFVDEDGMLCHAGRADCQVTVRGYRVETGDIEAMLLSLPGVDNVVVCTDVEGGSERIVAYLEGVSTAALSHESLRSRCRDLLPGHMIPAVFHVRTKFPRLSNGKVDIRQLCRSDSQRVEYPGIEPGLRAAKSLRDIWRAAFPGNQITPQSNYFDLGGDSLLAMRLMNQLAQLEDTPIPATLLLRHPTLGAFEKAVESLRLQHGQGIATVMKDVQCIARPYAQQNAELLEELSGLGYTPLRLQEVAVACEFAQRIFHELQRPGGKAFLSHSIGTASVLARHGATPTLVLAGLLHAAYKFGAFAAEPRGITPSKRQCVRAVIGEEAEDLVHRYAEFAWNSSGIAALRRRLSELTPVERNVVFMRLANELEEGADMSLLKWPLETRQLKANNIDLSVDVARALGMDDLATALELSYRRNAVVVG